METDGTPARKMRRIVDDDDDDDDDDLPDTTDPGFLKYQKPATPQPVEDRPDLESDSEGLFSDDDEGSGKEDKSLPSKKRFSSIPKVC
jgi:hypothetical protein